MRTSFINNGFTTQFKLQADYPTGYVDWSFKRCPPSYNKFRRLLCYSEPYTKHYTFEIMCKKIDPSNQFDVHFISNIYKNQSNVNKTVEHLFDTYHSNWKYFYVITKNPHNDILEKKVLNTQNLANFIQNGDMHGITEPDYKLIKEFQLLQKPLYTLILPENITEFKAVYVINDDLYEAQIHAVSNEYLYCIYSER